MLLEFDDGQGPIPEASLIADYSWRLEHPGLDVPTLFRLVTETSLRAFRFDRSQRATDTAALRFLEELRGLPDSERRDWDEHFDLEELDTDIAGLELALDAEEDWFPVGDFLPLARRFTTWLAITPECECDGFPFAGLGMSDAEMRAYGIARPEVLDVWRGLIGLLEDAERKGHRFRFTPPTVSECTEQDQERHDAWVVAFRRRVRGA